QINTTISYPKIHRVAGDRTLIYFRDTGHLGSWQYRVTSDHGVTWQEPPAALVDMDAPPHDAPHAAYAGSYHTTRVSDDGKTLHVAFIWKVEEPVFNSRYGRVLGDHTQRYNLYYLRVDLATGAAFNIDGKPLELPVRKSTADRDCLVWDTDQRVASVGPSIVLDDNQRPHMVLPISGKTSHECTFYYVRLGPDGAWRKTPITTTPHPFNASHLARGADGRFRVFLIAGEGQNVSDDNFDTYGWGDRVEEWVADPSGNNWRRVRDLTPKNKPGWRFQNVKSVFRADGTIDPDMLLFYGWRDANTPGHAYLLDER
ncbi:MAG: BNR-4 repeat-containing protein, partial [Planctomycetota bacterium]